MPLCFRCDRLEGEVCTSICIVFGEQVVGMIVDDWECLDDLLEILNSCVIEVLDVMQIRVETGRRCHGGGPTRMADCMVSLIRGRI